MEKTKILVCDLDQSSLELLQKLITNQIIDSAIYLSDPNNFLKLVQFHNPHLIITDSRFWYYHDGNSTIQQLRKNYSTPVIILENKGSEKIISNISFNLGGVYYVNGTNGISDLIKSITSAGAKRFAITSNLMNRFSHLKKIFKRFQAAS
ncbi:MAG: response regulator [Bacteroidia bacterium]